MLAISIDDADPFPRGHNCVTLRKNVDVGFS